VIFYTIFKIQQICLTIGVTFLQIRPWKDSLFCNVALGAAGRRGLPESGELAAVLGRGRARGGSLGSRGLVWVLGRGGGGRWWGARSGGRRPALCACFRRGKGAVGVKSGLGGFGRCSQSCGSAQTVATAGGQGTRRWRPWGAAAEQGAEGRACAAARGRLPF
jgi:hypothetical protein